MPPFLMKELNTLDSIEFEVALGYWMNHLNFAGDNYIPAAYDEDRYPDPKHKRQTKRNSLHTRKEQRNSALGFACSTLINYARYLQSNGQLIGDAHRQTLYQSQEFKSNKLYPDDPSKANYEPDVLAKAYHSALLIDPHGHKIFIYDTHKDNRQHDRIQKIGRTRGELIKLWHTTSSILKELNEETQGKQETRFDTCTLPKHHANATCHHSTPHLIRRLQQAITPGMTDIQRTPSVVIKIGGNQTSEAQEQSEEAPPSPPEPEQTDATQTLEQESVDLSAIESDLLRPIPEHTCSLETIMPNPGENIVEKFKNLSTTTFQNNYY
jgi:hypothetical protein